MEFPTGSLTLGKLEAIIGKLAPEIVFIDYVSIMKSNSNSDNMFDQLSDLHTGMRRIAGMYKIPIWSAHQANRPGFGIKTVEMQHVSNCIQVVAICDVAVSFNQPLEE